MSRENVEVVRRAVDEFQAGLARDDPGGATVELHMALLYELENGRVIRMRNFLDPADALQAAGLSE